MAQESVEIKDLYTAFKVSLVEKKFRFFPVSKQGIIQFFTDAPLEEAIKYIEELKYLAGEQGGNIVVTNGTPRIEGSIIIVNRVTITESRVIFNLSIKFGERLKKRNKNLARFRSKLSEMYGIKLEVELDE